jgi:hypothetical protein
VQEAEDLWLACFALAEKNGLPERTAAGLVDASYGLRLRNSRYRSAVEFSAGEEISELTSTRDLKAMVDAALLSPVGERRGRYYMAEEILLETRRRIRNERPPKESEDPFMRASEQLSLEI